MIDAGVQTDRLFIRRFEPADVPVLVRLFSDPEVARFVGDGKALGEAEAALWVERAGANIERHGYATGAVVEREGGELIGWAGFARPEGLPEEIIYGFAKSRWGRGYGGEILGALVALADGPLKLAETRATVDPLNVASATLLLRHGFQFAQRGYGGEEHIDLYVRRSPHTHGGLDG